MAFSRMFMSLRAAVPVRFAQGMLWRLPAQSKAKGGSLLSYVKIACATTY